MTVVALPLDGCRTEPLGSYLQGLGVWRVVARVADPQARACWREGRLLLHTQVRAEELVDTIVERFHPLPIVSPWNAGSGFAGNGKSREAEKALEAVRSTVDPRFAELREAVLAAGRVVALGKAAGWGGKGDKLWDDKRKPDLIALCRNHLPDESLAWIDAVVVTTQDETGAMAPAYNRLLGSGGNFGRQDLQATYLQRALLLLTDDRVRPQSAGWLRGVLFGEETTPYLREAVGQFDPGRAGGIQSSPAEKADDAGFSNPWAFLLTIEGATLFAAAATRRQGVRNVRATLPFVVRASGVGYGSNAVEENATAEIWTPQWDHPATLAEVEHLLREGRAEWRGDAARTGLDFARAVATLGVDSGVSRFTRSVFAERHGQSPLAVPVGEVRVTRRPGVALLEKLDPWLRQLRRDAAPMAIQTQLRRVDAAMFTAATAAAGGEAAALSMILVEVGRLHELVSRSAAARALVGPLVLSDPADWWERLLPTDGPDSPSSDSAEGAELRIAMALASGRDGGPVTPDGRRRPPLRALLQPWWTADSAGRGAAGLTLATVTMSGDCVAAVGEAHQIRCRPGQVPDPADRPDANRREWPTPAVRGVHAAFEYAWTVPATDVADLVGGTIDVRTLGDYLRAFLLFSGFRTPPRSFPGTAGDSRTTGPLPPGLALLLPFFGTRPIPARFDPEDPDRRILLRPGSSWLSQLKAGQVTTVLEDAADRLRIAGADAVIDPGPAARGMDGDLLAAALLVPISDTDRRRALAAVTVPKDQATRRTASRDARDNDNRHDIERETTELNTTKQHITDETMDEGVIA